MIEEERSFSFFGWLWISIAKFERYPIGLHNSKFWKREAKLIHVWQKSKYLLRSENWEITVHFKELCKKQYKKMV